MGHMVELHAEQLTVYKNAGTIDAFKAEQTKTNKALEDELNKVNEALTKLDSEAIKLPDVEKAISFLTTVADTVANYGKWFFSGLATIVILLFIWIFSQSRKLEQVRKNFEYNQSHNVAAFTNFINTVSNTVEVYRKQAETAGKQLEEGRKQLQCGLDQVKNELEKLREATQAQVKTLNGTAVELFENCEIHVHNRDKFKRDSTKLRLHSLAEQFNALSNTVNFNEWVSPISWFLYGLHAFNKTDYHKAIECLTKAKSLSETTQEFAGDDVDVQLGGKSLNVFEGYLKNLVEEIAYHLGIIHYNLGDRIKATQYFEQAVLQNTHDFRSKTFSPELRFFVDDVQREYVDETERKYQKLVTEFETSGAPSKMIALLKVRQGNIYIRKEIQISERANWGSLELRENEGPNKALECFQKAMFNDPDPPFVKCSLALAAHYANIENVKVPEKDDEGNVRKRDDGEVIFREQPWKYALKDVFYEFKGAAVYKNEPLLLIQVYYSAAICCHYAQILNEDPSAYFNRVRDHLRNVPEGVKIFSPVTKILRDVKGIQTEVDTLEQQFKQEPA
jgi:tetratricopeptide (TPR) repeat protein